MPKHHHCNCECCDCRSVFIGGVLHIKQIPKRSQCNCESMFIRKMTRNVLKYGIVIIAILLGVIVIRSYIHVKCGLN